MNTHQPQRTSQILDSTFRIIKNNFSSLFLVVLTLLSPIYIIQSILQIANGTSFFRQVSSEGTWFESFLTNLEGTQTFDSMDYMNQISYFGITGILTLVLFPVAEGAILLALEKIRNQEEWTKKEVIKRAFSRFGALLGSSILFMIIVSTLLTASIIIATLIGGLLSVFMNEIAGILIAILIGLGLFLASFYLIVKLSLFFAAVTFEKVAPGFSKSWKLTRKRFWQTFGIFFVFYVIISGITYFLQIAVTLSLGGSVFATLLISLATIITTLIFYVGYGQVYFDLKIRNEASDLKDMIESYKNEEQQ